jgi:hypothetical protein
MARNDIQTLKKYICNILPVYCAIVGYAHPTIVDFLTCPLSKLGNIQTSMLLIVLNHAYHERSVLKEPGSPRHVEII